jgi:SAM-dependent methyltransferase/methyltransferase-like protein
MAADEGNATAAGAGSSGDFEQLPYPSLPQPYTHPSHLAALAQLHGLKAPEVDTARVLEIGCASGGNIIALAVRFPKMRIAGFDLTARHIAEGQSRIKHLGLGNIDLRQGDVKELPFKGEAFDYIICHGLYSWVPAGVQDAVLQLTHACLASDGVAAISYNVLPGWHLRRVVRDICLHYSGTSGTPLQRVTKARYALEGIARSANASQPYGALLQGEAKRLALQPSAYVLGEFLAGTNEPCTFTEFNRRAEAHGLNFLCEADLDAAARVRVDRGGAGLMANLPAANGDDAVHAAGQALDFSSGRPFRRSLLIHAANACRATRTPVADRMSALHVFGQLRRGMSQTGNGVLFVDRFARPVAVQDDAGSAVVERIAAAYPCSIAVSNLIENLPATDTRSLLATLLAMVEAGHLSVSARPVAAGRANVERPRVSALNRLESTTGQPWITSLHHAAVAVTPLQAIVLQGLDGAHDRRMLVQSVAAALPRLGDQSGGQTPAQIVASALAHFEASGVLE